MTNKSIQQSSGLYHKSTNEQDYSVIKVIFSYRGSSMGSSETSLERGQRKASTAVAGLRKMRLDGCAPKE